MQHIIDLIEELQIYDAFDELEDLGINSPELEALEEEYENGAKPDFRKRFKQFVEGLDKKEEAPQPTTIINKNTLHNTGNNNQIFQGVSNFQGDVTIGGKGDKTAPKNSKKILFMAANPKNSQSLNLNAEYRSLQQEMRQGSHRDQYEWLSPVLAATLTEMMRGLNQQPPIIHYSGHGLNKGIVLEDNDGYAQVVSNEMLELLFRDLQGKLEIVFLNSCYSGNQAQFLSRLGCHVLGYSTPVGDKIAHSFAKGFYLGLSDGKDFQGALNIGRVMAMGEHPKDKLPLEVWKDGEQVPL